MVDVRHVRPDEWESLKAIRLRALRDAPEAFSTTHADAAEYGDEVWIERASGTTASASVVAVDNSGFVGLAVGILSDDDELDVVSVYVVPKLRGTGVAEELIVTVEAWGIEQGSARAVIDVEAGNDRAGAFYARLGYLPTGKRRTYPDRSWLDRVELAKSLPQS